MLPELFSLVLLGIWIYGIVDVLVTDKAAVRNLPKLAWLAIVVLGATLGVAIWFFFGRPNRSVRIGSDTASYPQPRASVPRRVRQPSRAERAEEEADVRARIEERDRLLAKWAEEDQTKPPPSPPEPS